MWTEQVVLSQAAIQSPIDGVAGVLRLAQKLTTTADTDISWSLYLQLIGPCWLLTCLVSIGVCNVLPRTWWDTLRIFTEDSVRLEHLDTKPIYLKAVKWKAITISLLSGLRLAQQVISIMLLHLESSSQEKHPLIWPYYAVAIAWALLAGQVIIRPFITPSYATIIFYAFDAINSIYQVLLDYALNEQLRYNAIFAFSTVAILSTLQLSLPLQKAIPSAKTSGDGWKCQATRALDSPEDNTSLFSWLFVLWMRPLLSTASARTLNDDDVWQLSRYFQHHIIWPVFRDLSPHKSLLRRIYTFSAYDIFVTSCCSLISAIVSFGNPYFLKRILEALTSSDADARLVAYSLAVLQLVLLWIGATVEYVRSWHSRRSYERTRGFLITMVFDKATRKKDFGGSLGQRKADEDEQDVRGADAGRILNFMNGDAYNVAQWFWEVADIFQIPLKLVIGIIFLYQILGWSALVGMIPALINYTIGYRFFGRLFQQLVGALRLLKYYAWEQVWVDKAIDAREKELAVRLIANWNGIYIGSLFLVTPALMILTTFVCYTKIAGRALTIPIAFPTIAVFAMISEPMANLPNKLMFYLNTLISVKRLERFFGEAELEHINAGLGAAEPDELSDTAATFENATFRFPQHEVTDITAAQFELRCAALSIPKGKITIVAGDTGSGKTALLLSLLGELDCTAGRCTRSLHPGSYAYVTQDSWLEQGTIRDNILFGEQYHPERFDAVLDACALKTDLVRWTSREHTEIGERGVSLSGGQRARVALARGVYSRATVLLLDDPLSAVDAQTARHIVDNCLAGPLLANRTVVLVTHHVNLCARSAALLIRMQDGMASVQAVVTASLSEQAHKDDNFNDIGVSESTGTTIIPTPFIPEPAFAGLITKEYRAEGSVKKAVYAMYLRAAGIETWIGIICMLLLNRLLVVLQQRFVQRWSESYDNSRIPWLPSASENVNGWLLGYLLFAVALVLSQLLRLAFAFHGSFKAARALLYACLLRVVHAPSRWLDENPTGRLLNRFTADIGSVDNTMNHSVSSVMNDLVAAFGSLLAVIFVVPSFVFFAMAAVVVYAMLSKSYVRASRDLRRMENNHRSPLFSRFGGLLQGLKVIRASAQQDRYLRMLNTDLDTFQSMDHFFWTARMYLALRFEYVAPFSVFLLTILALRGNIPQGAAAFAIVLSQQFVGSLHACIWSYAKLELDINSIERIHDLMETPQEAPMYIAEHRPAPSWPQHGKVVVRDLAVRYAPHLPLVLNSISFEAAAGQKIGIVGRTGSGKTTLAMSFLRVTEPAAGSITIDDLDISTIGVGDLRERVTIISQESTLFEGTVRTNLDPTNKHSDFELWKVLKRVGLVKGSQNSSSSIFIDSLEAAVTPNAENFSQGERQLLSIARALLRQSRVFIADEATASVALEADERVQHTLRRELSDATVITIAHRLRTIIDVDIIILLQDGVIRETGSPKELLKQENSHFRHLCRQSNEYDELARLAGLDV